MDERASMGAIGNMDSYMKFKAAQAIGDAARNEGGAAGAAAGLGAGAGLGAVFGQMIGQAAQPAPAPPPAQPAPPAAPAASAPATGGSSADRLQQLKTLGELKAAGVLTDAEFEAEKQRILKGE